MTTLAASGVECVVLPARGPNLNAHAERWVRSIKAEYLSKLILFGETSLRRAVSEFLTHYHQERHHQGKANLILFLASPPSEKGARGTVNCRERLRDLLKYYHREAALAAGAVAAGSDGGPLRGVG